MPDELPVPVRGRVWDELTDSERGFFCGDEYLPLHPSHAAQIRLLDLTDGRRVASWAGSAIPPGWPEHSKGRLAHEESLSVHDCWNSDAGRARVRAWLYARGVPFRRTVYLLYNPDCVVQTNWRMVVRFWDAFAWSVGYAMLAFDHTCQWVACFHHEEVFVFGSLHANHRHRPSSDDALHAC